MPEQELAHPQPGEKAKNIILLSDGTGNSAAKVWRTNVWRLFESLDLTNSRQVAIYNDGVGSSSFKPLAMLGGAFGWGLKRNVLDLYSFLCRNYDEPDTQIYAFGFSRGAFTVRVLLGLIDSQGLVPLTDQTPEEQLRRDAKGAYRVYRRDRYPPGKRLLLVTPLRDLRDAVIKLWNRWRGYADYSRFAEHGKRLDKPTIRFVGLWDTVAAYGLPISEMTHGVDRWIWPLLLPDRKLSDLVYRARHALSLDDERATFHPVLWAERDLPSVPKKPEGHRYVKDERLSQVWFAGVHTNVGGGYPDDSLAHVPLCWIMNEAKDCGLRVKVDPPADPDAVRRARSASDKDGRLYDSRHGLGGYYRYGPRKLKELCDNDEVTIKEPKIHESVFERIKNGAHAYAPIVLPGHYAVVTSSGQILDLGDPNNPYENREQAQTRADVQEHVWNLVWRRRIVYFATLAASLFLAAFPLFHETHREFSSPLSFLSPIIRMVGAMLPSPAGWWIDAYAANPGWFAVEASVVGILLWYGAQVAARITDKMAVMWRLILKEKTTPPGGLPNDWVYRLRTDRYYRAFVRTMKRDILPAIFALLFLVVALVAVSRVLFTVGDSFGVVCRGSENPQPAAGLVPKIFETSSLCWPSGVTLDAGNRYRITITIDPSIPWKDGEKIETDLGGFSQEKMSCSMYSGLPLRRTLTQPWFKPIARIGSIGGDEYLLDPVPRVGREQLKKKLVTELKARTTGELFLYVNDAVIGLPGLVDYFYVGEAGRNSGRAHIGVELVN